MPGKNRIPEKPWYSLEEAARLWEVDVDAILLYIRTGSLRPAFVYDDIYLQEWVGGSPSFNQDGTISREDLEAVAPPELHRNGSIYVWRVNALQIHKEAGGSSILLSDCIFIKSWQNDDIWFTTDMEEKIPLTALVITQDEIVRFEGLINPQKPLSDKERSNLLKTIGALARVISAKPGGKYGSSQKPNVNQIAEAILSELQSQGLEPEGLSNASLRDRLKRGLELLKE